MLHPELKRLRDSSVIIEASGWGSSRPYVYAADVGILTQAVELARSLEVPLRDLFSPRYYWLTNPVPVLYAACGDAAERCMLKITADALEGSSSPRILEWVEAVRKGQDPPQEISWLSGPSKVIFMTVKKSCRWLDEEWFFDRVLLYAEKGLDARVSEA
jgi:hypothetical protein